MNDLSVVPDYGVVSHRNALDQKSFNFNFNRSNLILWCIEVGWWNTIMNTAYGPVNVENV